jgi:hypothetical protein
MKGNEMGDNYLKVPASEPIPLSILELDLPAPPIGWAAGLAEKGVEVVLDDLGRLCVSRVDARRLLQEKRAAEQKAREMASENERQAVEADQQWRASMPRGVPWHRIDPGVLPVQQMTAAARDAQPRRVPTQNEWLFGAAETMVYNELPAEDES